MPEEPVKPPATPEPEKSAAPVPADPYANLPEAEREIAKNLDTIWGGLTTVNKRAVFTLAQEADAARAAAEAAREEGASAKTVAKLEDQAEDAVTRLVKRVESLESTLKERAEKEDKQRKVDENRREVAHFESEVKRVLDADEELAGDADACELLTEMFIGHYVKHRPQDIAGSFKRLIEKHRGFVDKKAAAKNQNFVRDKLRAAVRTRGESRSGPAQALEDWKPSGKDFDSGKLAEQIKERLGYN